MIHSSLKQVFCKLNRFAISISTFINFKLLNSKLNCVKCSITPICGRVVHIQKPQRFQSNLVPHFDSLFTKSYLRKRNVCPTTGFVYLIVVYRSTAVLDRLLRALAVAAVHDPSVRSFIRPTRSYNLVLLRRDRGHHLVQEQSPHGKEEKSASHCAWGSSRRSDESDSRRASSRGIIPRAKIKTVKMTFVIVFVFIVCWSPYIVFDLLQVFGHVPRTQTNIAVASFIQSLAPLNSAANPLIYCLFSTPVCRTLSIRGEDSFSDFEHTSVLKQCACEFLVSPFLAWLQKKSSPRQLSDSLIYDARFSRSCCFSYATSVAAYTRRKTMRVISSQKTSPY
ncbi:hypothetical protein B566_EDAN001761 [Ephemera danica]|nr:hypothetical protein B566_EDAN001761 [Ephemera danica]